MAVLHQNIPDDLLSEFSETAREKFGDKKGAKHSALLEAIREWLTNQKNSPKARK